MKFQIPTNETFTMMELDTGNVCQLKCPTCNRQDPEFKSELSKAKYLTVDDFRIILRKFPNVNRFFLGLIFDEPTFNPHLVDIIHFLKKQGKSITLNTNGGLNVKAYDWLYIVNFMDHTDRIVWSMDGLSQETYQQHRKNGNFLQLLETISFVIRNNQKYPGPTHIIQIIKFEHNKEEIETKFESFKLKYHLKWEKPVWDIIDSNGRCTIPTEEVKPTWDIDGLNKLHSDLTDDIIPDNPACLSDTTIFMGHNGQLGLCLSNTLESLKQREPFNIYNSIEDINQYIETFYKNFHQNKTCKFLCSSKLQEKKLKLKLDITIT